MFVRLQGITSQGTETFNADRSLLGCLRRRPGWTRKKYIKIDVTEIGMEEEKNTLCNSIFLYYWCRTFGFHYHGDLL
jgi:hypothetical protein